MIEYKLNIICFLVMEMKKKNIMKVKPLVNREYLLEKFPGKGGWTYALIPEILQDKHSHFGWVIVNGSIDGYEIKKFHSFHQHLSFLYLD